MVGRLLRNRHTDPRGGVGEQSPGATRPFVRPTIAWVIEQVMEKERPFDHVIAQLGLG